MMTNPGDWLRERREELHLTRSGVERLTNESASKAANERYLIRRDGLPILKKGLRYRTSLQRCLVLMFAAIPREPT
jgi:hypothetical protein